MLPVTSFPSPRSTSWCSGVLWKPRIVLTSAHCVVIDGTSIPFNNSQVRVGRPGSVRGDGDVFYPTAIITPSNFVNGRFVTDQDFAALVFDRDIGSTNVTRLATSAEAEAWAAAGSMLDVVGYGTASPVSDNPLVLRTSLGITAAPVRSGHRWIELRATAERATCPGDSGGGVLVGLPTGERLLVGIIAGGRSPCTRSSSPFVTVAAMPVGFLPILDRALALAGYPQIPSAPVSARAVSFGSSRTVVEWSPPERHADAVASFSVVTADSATLCSVPAGSTNCEIQPAIAVGTPLQVRASNALGEIASVGVTTTGIPVRRLDLPRRPALEPGMVHQLQVCLAKPAPSRLEERRGSRWMPIGRSTPELRPELCPAGRPHLAVFTWRAPMGNPKGGVSMRLASPGARPVEYLLTVRTPG